jgi:quercetin dioxygenase-like cupin family protein
MLRAAICAFSLLFIVPAGAQERPMGKTTMLQRAPVEGAPDRELFVMRAEWPPGSGTPPHTQPGDEIGTVLEGSYEVREAAGEWRTLKAGDSWRTPAGVVHETRAPESARTINVFIVQKGFPLILPVK